MTILGTIKSILVAMTGETGMERLQYRSTAIVSGALFALGLALLVAMHMLLMIFGAAFVAIPAILGILTMEIKRVRPCLLNESGKIQ
jgi:hypothetical protein